jgi:hypothetical protein
MSARSDKGKQPKGSVAYEAIMVASGRDLAPDEFWVIDHSEGTLWDTASKRLDAPVKLLCEATGLDWDQAMEAGFWLTKKRRVN